MARETKVDVYMPLFVADYLADTSHLSCEEDGAYLRILMHLWRRDGRIEFDHDRLAAICKLPRRRWDAVWKALAGFFEVRDGILSQGRLSHELAIAYARKQEASEAGKRGAAKRWGGHSDPNGHPMATPLRPQWRNDGSSSPSPTEESSPPAPARDPGAGPTEPKLWMSGVWLRKFSAAWGERYQLTYGGGAATAKACGSLDDILAALPEAERAQAQSRVAEMLRRYLDDPSAASRKHPFQWFVDRFDALRAPNVTPMPIARGSPVSRDPRHGHARADDFRHTQTGEVKL